MNQKHKLYPAYSLGANITLALRDRDIFEARKWARKLYAENKWLKQEYGWWEQILKLLREIIAERDAEIERLKATIIEYCKNCMGDCDNCILGKLYMDDTLDFVLPSND